jgi:hypothetical protein
MAAGTAVEAGGELARTPRAQGRGLAHLAAGDELNRTWQRWTIDELYEGRARVLVSLARRPLESTAAEARDHAERESGAGAELQRAVTRLEFASTDDLWGPELAAYVNARALERFVKRRTDVPALPDHRPLREGDVFWIVQAPDGAPTSPSALLRGEARDAVEVWDVTAAARQAVKHTYDEAVRASEGS